MPPKLPKTTRVAPPRVVLAQAPKTLWLVWGPKTWVEIEWDRNPETNVLGYILRRGPASRIYDVQFHAGNETSVRAPVIPGARYYFVVVAYDFSGLESGMSNELVYQAPFTPPALHASITRLAPVNNPVGEYKIEARGSLTAPWEHYAESTNAFLQVTATDSKFFRVLKKP